METIGTFCFHECIYKGSADEGEIENSEKKLDSALSGVDDNLKKKLNKKNAPAAKPYKSKVNAPTAPNAIPSKTSSLNPNGIKTKGKKQQASSNDGKAAKNKDIQEEGDEEGESGNVQSMDGTMDPDTRMIEEFHKKTMDESTKWETILDIQDILNQNDDRNVYILACKVLGIIPASSVISSLESSQLLLAHRGIGAKGAQALADALQKNTTWQEVNLENNWMAQGGSFIGTAMTSNIHITNLNLADNRLGRECGKAIAEMISDNGYLKILNLSGNSFSDREIELFGNALKQNMALTHLNLSHNDFGDVGISALGSGLAAHEQLQDLDVSWNKIRAKGFIAFFNAIKDNSILANLNFYRNGMGETSVSIATFLAKNLNLKSLNVGCNRIGDNMIQILAKPLETSSNITELDVSGNLFTDKGAAVFLKAVLNCQSLVKVNIQGLRLSKESLAKIEEIKKERSDLVLIEE